VVAEPEKIAESALAEYGDIEEGVTFAVRCKRHGEKGKWTSQTFAGAIGAAVLERAPQLKVDLSNPDWELRVALFPDRANLLGERIMGPGGLPSGVQGLVLAHLETELDLISAWLIMHRGCRIQAVSGSTQNLESWDPALKSEGEAKKLVTGPGRKHNPEPWGIVGANLNDAPTTVGKEELVKIPLAHLEPLIGWSENEIDELRLQIFN
ncbi:MAG: THUMP domain-containing protein, partial [Candidatus Thalassarchaeaceae archaeon]|nr:THUMP domain-containing protein [Candidatus Thalassarchaeaceae archaeon]